MCKAVRSAIVYVYGESGSTWASFKMGWEFFDEVISFPTCLDVY